MTRILPLMTLFFLVSFSLAHAKEINDEGAKTLKSSFQKIFEYQKKINEGFGTVQVIYDGEVNVEQETDHYVITLPNITLQSPEGATSEDAITFEVGVLKINAVPSDKENYWNMTMIIPSTMTIKDSTGADILSLSSKDQETVALFNDQLGYFTKLNTTFSDITMSVQGEPIAIDIGGLQLYMNLIEDENSTHRYSGPGHVLISNLQIKSKTQDEAVRIGEARLDYSMSDVKLPTLTEYQEKLEKHMDTFASLQQIEEIEGAVPDVDPDAIIDMLYDLYDFDMSGFSFGYSGKDIEIISQKTDTEEKKGDTIRLGSAAFGLGFDGFDRENGTFALKFAYDDFHVADEELKGITPESANFEINALNIPYVTLNDLGTNTLKTVTENPESAQMLGLGLVMRLPAILSQAGTELKFINNGASSNVYDVNMNGSIVTDLSSLIGFTARFNTVFEGLDSLLEILKNKSDSEKVKQFARAELINTLENLQSVGAKRTGPNGKSAYGFVIETSPQGQILINGKEAQSVLSDERESKTPEQIKLKDTEAESQQP